MSSTTRWFFDTEFIDTGSIIDPISIALVSEDGRRSYSACLSGDWERTMPEWQLKNVLPHLPPPEERIHSRQQVADEILKLVGDGLPEFWAYFASYDWVVLCQLVNNGGRMIDLPKHWPKFVCDLKMLMHLHHVSKKSLPERPKDEKHDALSDARWARDTYVYLQEKVIGPGAFLLDPEMGMPWVGGSHRDVLSLDRICPWDGKFCPWAWDDVSHPPALCCLGCKELQRLEEWTRIQQGASDAPPAKKDPRG